MTKTLAELRLSRGFRNQNPTNLNFIPPSAKPWNGQDRLGDEWLPTPQRRFGHYVSHQMGIRAGAGQLVANQLRYGKYCIALQIKRWAPEEDENDTDGYISKVCKDTGLRPWDGIDVRKYSICFPLISAIISMECGGMPYQKEEINAGLELYGITPWSEH
jgi:hypothetical protein